MKYKNNKHNKYKKLSCSNCGSQNIVKRGHFKTKAHGKQQRYYCKNCNKKFIEQTPFYRMRNHPKKITLCLDLFYKGISTREIQQHLQAFYPHNSSNVSIYKWVIKYSKVISKFTDKLKLRVGQELQIDEMEFHRRKNHKRKDGIERNWFIDCIDTRTKFLVSAEYSKGREQAEVKKVLDIAKTKTQKQISIITSDGWLAYPKAIQKTFVLKYGGKGRKIGVEHNIVNASHGEGFNYPIERLHNSIRQRTQNFRGFHGSVESARTILKGFEIYYNFIRKHQSIKRTPSELATDIKLTNPNKWLELINLSY